MSNLKTALKRLSRQQRTQEDWRAILDEFLRAGNDRSAAIIAASALEDALEELLLATMRPELSKDERARLFEGDAPLSTFSSKIRIAYAIGAVGRRRRNDLDYFREIRNAFAHTIKAITFETPEVAALCSLLKVPLAMRIGPDDESPKERYLLLATHLIDAMIRLALQKERRGLRLARARRQAARDHRPKN
jgi:DNA-binding MltR family transcriptional regulator